ncbi:MAG: SIMPL domain-containing protein [Actinoplanes sp.]
MPDQPMIVVRGEALREVPPEQAVLSVSVSSQGRDRDVVLAFLTERSAEVRALIAEFGDAVERRETGGVHIYPEFKRQGSERRVTYAGSVGTTVTVIDFAVLGDLVSRLASIKQAGISGPWWQLRPGSKAGAEVRREAIGEALTRAREYAAAVGARVDRLVEIADEGSSGFTNLGFRSAAFKGEQQDSALELDPQVQTVQATVIVRVTITEPDLGD